MGAIRLHPDFANVAANAIITQFNSGYLRIYDGDKPATASDETGSAVLLAELRFAASNPFAAAVSGSLVANPITQDDGANATGTATWFRILKSDGTTTLLDGTAGTVETSPDLVLSSTSFTESYPVAVTSFTYSFPLQPA